MLYHLLVAVFLCLPYLCVEVVYLLIIDRLLTLQELQAHIRGTQVATDADKVCLIGVIAIDDVFLLSLADARDAYGQSCQRRACVAAHDVNVPLVASLSEPSIEIVEVLDLETLAQGNAHKQLAWRAVHGKHVAQVDHRALVAQLSHAVVGEVEVHALHQHVGGDEHLLVGIIQHRAIITHAFQRRGVLGLQVFSEPVDETELSKFLYLVAYLHGNVETSKVCYDTEAKDLHATMACRHNLWHRAHADRAAS